jgi:hypothetical protein
MIKKIASSLLLLVAGYLVQAQTTTPPAAKKGRPDIPGTFVVELGLNRDLGGPDNFSLNLWGSRTVNIYYQYDIRILKSRFSFVPGIGLSLERFNFKKFRVLRYESDDSLKLQTPVGAQTAGFPLLAIHKSRFINNYIDVPLELKYSTKPDDPSRSIKISVGGRIGYMYDSFTKIKYKDDGEMKKLKDKQDFGLTKFRYGVSAKLGVGNFSLFGYYNLTNLFQSGKGPYIRNTQQDFPTMTVGISLSSF